VQSSRAATCGCLALHVAGKPAVNSASMSFLLPQEYVFAGGATCAVAIASLHAVQAGAAAHAAICERKSSRAK
jgi:hypothetical protein